MSIVAIVYIIIIIGIVGVIFIVIVIFIVTLTVIPIIIIIGTGILLQVKKEINWIQPTTTIGKIKNNPSISFDEILTIAKTVPDAEIHSWEDIDRLDVRIQAGMVKVRSKNNWEIQIDTQSGPILQHAYRRSDIIESIHDGS